MQFQPVPHFLGSLPAHPQFVQLDNEFHRFLKLNHSTLRQIQGMAGVQMGQKFIPQVPPHQYLNLWMLDRLIHLLQQEMTRLMKRLAFEWCQLITNLYFYI